LRYCFIKGAKTAKGGKMNIEYAFLYTKRETGVRNRYIEFERQSAGNNNRTVIQYGLRGYVPVKDTFIFNTLKKET
jgi:hypothetical protein